MVKKKSEIVTTSLLSKNQFKKNKMYKAKELKKQAIASKSVTQNKTKETVQLKDNRQMSTPFNGANAPIQMAGGKVHHNPKKKKYLSKGIGNKQVWVSNRALQLIKGGMSRKAATRQAKSEYPG